MVDPVIPVQEVESVEDGAALRHLLDTAQRFFACRDRAMVYSRWSDPPPVRTLAEAIERDFAGFDMERAEAEFRAALAALSNGPGGARAPRRGPVAEAEALRG